MPYNTCIVVHQVLPDGLLLGVAQQPRGLAVPLGHHALGVDAEDGSVGTVDEAPQVVGDALLLLLHRADLGDILTDANHADDLAVWPAAGGRVQQQRGLSSKRRNPNPIKTP